MYTDFTMDLACWITSICASLAGLLKDKETHFISVTLHAYVL